MLLNVYTITLIHSTTKLYNKRKTFLIYWICAQVYIKDANVRQVYPFEQPEYFISTRLSILKVTVCIHSNDWHSFIAWHWMSRSTPCTLSTSVLNAVITTLVHLQNVVYIWFRN